MIRISAAPITDLASLRAALHDAIRLEFFTIPPYLTALYTLSGSSLGAQYARTIIRNVVRDEMLHMNLACNILNAIGGAPDIKGAIPSYPSPLPMALAGGLEVHLKRYSKQLIESVFMEIEKPETPLDIPEQRVLSAAAALGPQTIGQFYAAIRAEIVRQGESIFTGKKEKQVTGFFFGKDEDITVVDVATAMMAIDTIVEQGEGTPQSPVDLQGDIAHYYRFQELAKGMKLVPTPKPHFDPNQPVSIDDAADVVAMIDDPQTVALDPADTDAIKISDECDQIFTNVVNQLHEGYNGTPEAVTGAWISMLDLGQKILALLKIKLTAGPHAGFNAGPRFLFKP
jgi:hypothetical protein